ncbi:MAG: hypothetical protein WB612_03275 [Nitrososphaeraceae archaeon]
MNLYCEERGPNPSSVVLLKSVLIFDGATQIGTASGDSPPTHA